MARFYQFTALDLYHKVVPASQRNITTGAILPNTDTICPEILLILAQNLYKYGNRTMKFHAYLLELDTDELRFTIKTLTGKTFTDFSEDFLVLMIRDLLGDFPKHGKVQKIAKQLGYSTSGLYRFMTRKMKRTPSGWCWW